MNPVKQTGPTMGVLLKAMAISRSAYIKQVISHGYQVGSHLIKAVEFRVPRGDTHQWLVQAETPLVNAFNASTDKRLTKQDFDKIRNSLLITDEWSRRILGSMVSDWFTDNKTLALSKTTTQEITEAVNEIITEQCEIAYRDIVLRFDRYYEGSLSDSRLAWQIIKEFSKLDYKSLSVKDPNEIKATINRIKQQGIIS